MYCLKMKYILCLKSSGFIKIHHYILFPVSVQHPTTKQVPRKGLKNSFNGRWVEWVYYDRLQCNHWSDSCWTLSSSLLDETVHACHLIYLSYNLNKSQLYLELVKVITPRMIAVAKIDLIGNIYIHSYFQSELLY